MMEVLFFTALIAYFFAVILQIVGVAVSRPRLTRAARCIFAAALLLHTAFTVWRGVAAARLPLANQFEFASGFAWAAAGGCLPTRPAWAPRLLPTPVPKRNRRNRG